jgi:hypothetical protein
MTLAESLTISAGSATGVLAGEARGASGVTLLPASFRGAISGALPPAEPVRLGAVQAYRYAALHVRGVSEEVTVFVAPTSAGAATIACLGRRVVRAECERVAATLRLLGTSSQPLGPSGDYASSLSRVLRRLGQETATAQRSLTAAGTPDQQAGAERALASAAARAAGDAEQISAPLQAQAAHSALTRALRDLDGAYGAAAAAARSGDQGAYAAAGRRLSSASKLLADALRELQTLGYTLST